MNSPLAQSVVFKNGNSLAVRLIGDCKFPVGTKVKESRVGNKVILEAITDTWPSTFLNSLGCWNEEIERPSSDMKDPFK